MSVEYRNIQPDKMDRNDDQIEVQNTQKIDRAF